MGAYAAIRYSGRCRFDRVLAVSPLFDIKLPWDDRYKEDIVNLRDEPMMAANYIYDNGLYCIAYDPRSVDAKHFARYRDLVKDANLLELKFPYSGHPSGFFLNEVGLLKPIASSFLVSAKLLLYRAPKAERVNSVWYLHNLALACQKANKKHWALSLCASARKLEPKNVSILATCAVLELEVGDLKSAEATAREAAALELLDPHRQLGLAWVLKAAGKFEEALDLIEIAIPHIKQVHFWRSVQDDCRSQLDARLKNLPSIL